MDDRTQKPLPEVKQGPPVSTADAGGHAPAALDTLKRAMRRARFDDAERAGVVADLRDAQLGRLELLREALAPLIRQIPDDVDIFDIGLMPGVSPRLFIDMIGFVEMSRDTRLYSFFQDTRHGRILMGETGDIDTMVDAITDYVARRMLDRDKALASDARFAAGPTARQETAPTRPPPTGVTATKPVRQQTIADRHTPEPRAFWTRFIGAAFAFLIDLLGAITFFTLIGAAAWIIWSRMHGQSN